MADVEGARAGRVQGVAGAQGDRGQRFGGGGCGFVDEGWLCSCKCLIVLGILFLAWLFFFDVCPVLSAQMPPPLGV